MQSQFVSKLRRNFYLLSKNFPGNEEVLVQLLYAWLTRENVFWYSRPGRAKSLIATSAFGMFDDATVFSVQCTKDTPEEKLFGNIIPNAMMAEGKEIYNLDGGLVKAVFAFLDEFMDLSDMVMRSANSVFNERVFYTKDMGPVPSPLHSAIATSNYMRVREATQAVLDRFMCKAYLKGIDGVADSMRASETYLEYSGKQVQLEKLPYAELDALADLVGKSETEGGVVISNAMRLLHVLMVSQFQNRRIKAAQDDWMQENPGSNPEDMPSLDELGVPDISPRTMVKLYDFVRASAVLDGRTEVVQEDLQAIKYGLIAIGDGSGDEAIWAAVCKDMLGMNGKQMDLMQKLGDLAAQVGTIEAERSERYRGTVALLDTTYTVGQLTLARLNTIFPDAKSKAVTLALEEVADAIKQLAQPRVGFDLLRGWK
jgi:MoxR-like ATPase